jgi:hypothetical protein
MEDSQAASVLALELLKQRTNIHKILFEPYANRSHHTF